MPQYIHTPQPEYISNNLKIIFGSDEYYYESRTSAESDTDFTAAKFGDVTLEGIKDWELVWFGVMWERLGNEGAESFRIRDSDSIYGNGYFTSDINAGKNTEINGQGANLYYDTACSNAAVPVGGHWTDTTEYAAWAYASIEDFAAKSVSGVHRYPLPYPYGASSGYYSDGTTGWEGYTHGINTSDSIGTTNDYSDNAGSGWTLAIPMVPVQWGTLYYWGPGRYIKNWVKNHMLFLKPNGNRTFGTTYGSSEVKFKFFMRTENQDTVYSEERTLYDAKRGVGAARLSSEWVFNRGEILPEVISSGITDNGIITNITYPEISQVELTYPVSAKLSSEKDDTKLGFIYRGRLLDLPNNFSLTANGTEDTGVSATATANVGSGQVTFITVNSGGSGYLSAPTIAITGGGGTSATATAEVSGGVLSFINVTSGGSSYADELVISIDPHATDDDTASGAIGVATIVGGVITAITLSSGGSGYDTAAPTITITGGRVSSGSDATATATTTTQSATITGATKANPVRITATGHPHQDGDTVAISGVVGMTELNGNTYGIDNKTADTFELTATDGTGFTTYVSGGTASRTGVSAITVTSGGSGYVDPLTITFTGGGLGGFTDSTSFTGFSQNAWMNNSALCTWDFIESKRFGMGHMVDGITDTTSTQYSLLSSDIYNAALRCHELVGKTEDTGQEIRYPMNVVIDGDQSKIETLGQMCSNFHAKHYFHDGYLRIYQDRPATITKVINQSNATNFSYAGSTDRTRTNTVFVKFNNPSKLFKQDVAYAEDRDALIPPTPVISKEVIAFGITSRGQAIRHGRWILEQEAYSEQVITYTAGFDHYFMKPGDIIVHSDSANDGQRNGGRISSLGGAGTAWTITFDTVLDWTPDLTKTYYIYFQNGQNDQNDAQLVIKGKVDAWFGPSSGYTSAQVVTTVALNDPVSGWSVPSTAFANIPYVISEEYQETLYRVERISEGQHPFEYEVTALRYSDDRFKKIDDGFIVGFSFDTNIPDTYTEDS